MILQADNNNSFLFFLMCVVVCGQNTSRVTVFTDIKCFYMW